MPDERDDAPTQITPAGQKIRVPSREEFDEFVRKAFAVRGDTRTVVTDPEARYWGVLLEKDTLLPGPDAQLATTRFDDWLPLNPPPAK